MTNDPPATFWPETRGMADLDALLKEYFHKLSRLFPRIVATDYMNATLPLHEAVAAVIDKIAAIRDQGGALFFVGNGGSAAIASHMANDYARNLGVWALSLNDSSVLTCVANDCGYHNVFSEQLRVSSLKMGLLVAISSSGSSPNILNAVVEARRRGFSVLTMSGFSPANPLRSKGWINIYVPEKSYGLVEILHMIIAHLLLDIASGSHYYAPSSEPKEQRARSQQD